MNQFFDAARAEASDHGGKVLRFMGDALLAILPIVDGEKVAAAIDVTQLALDWIEF